MDYHELMRSLIKIFYDKKMERHLIIIKKLMALMFGFRGDKERKTNHFLGRSKWFYIKKIKKFYSFLQLMIKHKIKCNNI
jgi:hypothetical protein